MTTVRAAAVQLSPVLYSREGTVEHVVAKIDELAGRGVQFATFPETVVPYYPYFSFVQRQHYNPLARYAMIADGEQIHSAIFPGSIFGDLFAQQTEIQVRNHALESGVFVVAATAWLDPDQQGQIMADTGSPVGPISGGCFTTPSAQVHERFPSAPVLADVEDSDDVIH